MRGVESACTAYPAGGGHVSIDGQGLAAAEEQVVHCGQLAVKPDVDVDDGHPLQPLQLAEVRPGLPLLGNDSLHHINCSLEVIHVCEPAHVVSNVVKDVSAYYGVSSSCCKSDDGSDFC